MKTFLVLLFALLMLICCGCTPDPATDTPQETTVTNTRHPLNTYAILRDEMDRISSLVLGDNANDLQFKVTNIYVDDTNSTLVVGIQDINDEKIRLFKEKISDADFIVFKEGGNIVLTTE